MIVEEMDIIYMNLIILVWKNVQMEQYIMNLRIYVMKKKIWKARFIILIPQYLKRQILLII